MLFFVYYKLQKYEKYSYLSLFFLLCHFLLLILHAFLDMGELILGILCGIALSLFFSFGPAFFSQIRMSIQYGYRKSYPFAFGVSASDVIIVFLMLTVLKNVDLYELLHNVWVASIGGLVLVLMGFYYLKKEVKTYENKQSKIKFKSIGSDPRRRTIFMQGFVINLANPLIWIYWVSVIALLTGELNLTVAERYIFFVGVLGSTLGLDILKCKLASMLQQIITAKLLNITNKICAVVMFAFAAYIVVSMVLYQVSPKVREHEQQQGPPSSTQVIKKIHHLQKDENTFSLFHSPRLSGDSSNSDTDSKMHK